MKYSTPYQKVLCRFYDQLEIYAMHNTKVAIIWKDGAQDAQEIVTTIKTLSTENSEEFLITEEDIKIRLDLITSLLIDHVSTEVPSGSCATSEVQSMN